MIDITTGSDGRGRIKLPAIADSTIGAELKKSLLETLETGAGVDVDASAVQRVTSPVLQILVAAMRSFQSAGGPGLRIAEPSAPYAESVAALALNEIAGA